MFDNPDCSKAETLQGFNSENTESNYSELIGNAMELIQKNYADLYGVEELAEELAVSKCHLVRAFSAAAGISPGKYLTAIRIAAAKKLLLSKDYPVEVVATLSGFSGANYFCKVFKKATGKTPLEYKNNVRPQEPEPEMTEMEKRLFV